MCALFASTIGFV